MAGLQKTALVERVAAFLNGLKPFNTVRIGYSGGVDSTVLLHAATRCGMDIDLQAVHINHGLHPDAGRWTEHCRTVCREWAVPLTVRDIDAGAGRRESPEAAAREARYEAFRALLGDGDVLLTAQHQTDQAETVLLQLFRGAGPAGLAGMAAVSELGKGCLGRPLLEVSRDEIMFYARENALSWVEDSSNTELGFSRNYLRQAIWPRLREHWPGLGKTLARSARLQARAAEVLETCARDDLDRLAVAGAGALPAAGLLALSEARRNNLLRYWLARHGAPTPSEAVLEQVWAVASAREDAVPCVAWAGREVRRHKGCLYLIPAGDIAEPPARCYSLSPGGSVYIPELELALTGEQLKQAGLRLDNADQPLTVCFRQGGERIRLIGRRHHHSLKKLLQSHAVPPWLRDRLPLIYHGDELIGVLGLEPPLIAAGWSEDEE